MKRERGQALLLVLILLGVGAALIVPLLLTVDTVSKTRQLYIQTINEDYAADAAVEYGMWRLKHEPGFADSLPIGSESAPFFVTLNGITANTTVTAQTLEFELSGQQLAGRAENEIYFRVEKEVVATATYTTLVADGFEVAGYGCSDGNDGTGTWNDDWVFSGNYIVTSSGEHEGDCCLELIGDDNGTPGDGYAEREASLAGSSGLGPYLSFWARVSEFEDSTYDEAYLKVSTDGVDWDILKTFTEDDNGDYRQYYYDLSSYGTPISFFIAFETDLSSTHDYLYIDDIQFTNAEETTEIEPGVGTMYTYFVTIQCLDPDGCTLDRIVDELPERGASSGDYLQYVDDSTDWDIIDYNSFAFDGFETSGDTGPWIGDWVLTGSATVTTDSEYEGDQCLQLLGSDPTGDGYAVRQIDLSTYTGEGPYLYFWSRISQIETPETISVRVSTDGSNWDVLESYDNADDDSQYHQYWYDLSDYGRPSNFYISFLMNGNHYSDSFKVDNVEISDSQEEVSGEWPPIPPFDPTSISTIGSYSSRYQQLEWDFEDAGYSNIDFDYGETRIFNFQAEAALTEGTYCNRIWVSNSDYGDEAEIINGATAKIIVGDPAVTNCNDGKLEVTKASDPEIVYPYEETTVTYTITIENVDTVDIPIYTIEDWLPATGSLLAEEGFMYVDDSASGRIIGRESEPVLFYDSFSRSNSYTVSGWTDSDTTGGNARIDSESAYLRSNASITKSGISTANQTSIKFTYRWNDTGSLVCESSDKLRVEWKRSSSGTWTLLAEHPLNTTSWHDQSPWSLPSSADNTTIDIRFTGITNDTNEYGRVDSIRLYSSVTLPDTPICMPDDNDGDDFLYEDWEYDWPYWEYRWSITWDFSNYPEEDDSMWDQNQDCHLYPNEDYNPTLVLSPGEVFEIVFQAQGTLTYSGSYFNEVFVKISEGGYHDDDEWLYSWPTGTVIVPQYDLQASTLNEILRANALLSPQGHWWRSWHWWRRR